MYFNMHCKVVNTLRILMYLFILKCKDKKNQRLKRWLYILCFSGDGFTPF